LTIGGLLPPCLLLDEAKCERNVARQNGLSIRQAYREVAKKLRGREKP
jgi:hypothetical protein